MYNNKEMHENVFTKYFRSGGPDMATIMPKKTF